MTEHPRRETITYEATSNVSTNDTIIGDDFDNVEGDRIVASNEVFEVERIELVSPPQNADGSVQPCEWIRLHDGDDYYPNIRFRFWMLGYLGPNFGMASPRLGQPVLENKANPANRPLLTACPKFGPEDQVNIALKNDGNQISDNFAVKIHGWRFKGTSREMQEYFQQASNLQTSINQSLNMSNPFSNESGRFSQDNIEIRPGAEGGAHGQFTRLTGGVNQNLPKVYPWATWADNNSATRTNTDYEFSFAQDNVADKWQELYFDFSDGENAAQFDYVMVQEDVTNLLETKVKLESRDSDEIPAFNTEANDQHELPVVRRLADGTHSQAGQVEVPIAGSGTNMVHVVDRVPRRVSKTLQKQETMVWNDEGGVVVQDDGTSISSNGVRVGVIGRRMNLEG